MVHSYCQYHSHGTIFLGVGATLSLQPHSLRTRRPGYHVTTTMYTQCFHQRRVPGYSLTPFPVCLPLMWSSHSAPLPFLIRRITNTLLKAVVPKLTTEIVTPRKVEKHSRFVMLSFTRIMNPMNGRFFYNMRKKLGVETGNEATCGHSNAMKCIS